MARYGVAWPLPQEEEIVRPKTVIFTDQGPRRYHFEQRLKGVMYVIAVLLPKKHSAVSI
jgi:hypothetical protein